MDWSDLRIFLAVAQHGSLRRAADMLGVTQPTIARRLRNLETDMGLALFDRGRDGHRLTPAGIYLLPDIRAVESAALRVEQRSLGLATQLTETVRVAAGQTSAAVLARGLHRLTSGPAVELVVTDAPGAHETRTPDIFLFHDIPVSQTGVTRRVGSINCAVYGAKSFANARTLPLSPADLSTLPWLGFGEEQEHYVTMQWLNEVMRGRPPAARMVNTDLMAVAAAEGVGIAVLPCFKGDENAQLMRLSEQIVSLRADYWTLIQPDLARNPSIRVVADWIAECFRHVDTSHITFKANIA